MVCIHAALLYIIQQKVEKRNQNWPPFKYNLNEYKNNDFRNHCT